MADRATAANSSRCYLPVCVASSQGVRDAPPQTEMEHVAGCVSTICPMRRLKHRSFRKLFPPLGGGTPDFPVTDARSPAGSVGHSKRCC